MVTEAQLDAALSALEDVRTRLASLEAVREAAEAYIEAREHGTEGERISRRVALRVALAKVPK